jgi:hypothetical protein
VQNSGIRYRDSSLRILEQWGGLPHLVRAGKVKVQIKFDVAAQAQGARAFAVDLSGHRREPVDLQTAAGALTLTLDTSRAAGGCLAYEIVR